MSHIRAPRRSTVAQTAKAAQEHVHRPGAAAVDRWSGVVLMRTGNCGPSRGSDIETLDQRRANGRGRNGIHPHARLGIVDRSRLGQSDRAVFCRDVMCLLGDCAKSQHRGGVDDRARFWGRSGGVHSTPNRTRGMPKSFDTHALICRVRAVLLVVVGRLVEIDLAVSLSRSRLHSYGGRWEAAGTSDPR